MVTQQVFGIFSFESSSAAINIRGACSLYAVHMLPGHQILRTVTYSDVLASRVLVSMHWIVVVARLCLSLFWICG